jgi:hypothetical protein
MALRGFVGDDGRDWQVWDTRPTMPSPNVDASDAISAAAPSAAPPSAGIADFARISRKREGGWLTFTTTRERRRLSPIPDGWDSADDATLRALLAVADRISGAGE